MNIKNSILTLLIGSLALIGCKKDFDTPPLADLPAGNIITIDSLRKIYTAFDTTITADLSVYGTVTADEISGNLYKVLYIQDATNAIQLELTASSSRLFFQGDRVRVALKGLTVARENNMLKVINVDPEKQIIKQTKGEEIAPKVVTIADLAISGVYSPFQGQLVQLNDVEFICDDIWSTYADPIAQYDQNRTLSDTSGNTIIVRSSGYSSFAGTRIAQGKGSFTAIVSQYNTTVQLTIRKLEDLSLTGTRKIKCPVYVKNFEDQSITSGGWTKQNVVGNINWSIADVGSNNTYYAMISNYSGTNTACETWLVSPSFDLTNLTNPILYFQSAYKYTGDALRLYVTTAYTGDATTTTWTDITSSASWSTGNFIWAGSGNINLSSYKQAGVRFAFKYTGTNSNGSTWEIDDFTINDL
ncbi:MAG: hypothetical protein KFKLKKLM_00639 [Flavobacteriales bacterium]|nr:hypothetical protein [Flavobacteriales bacterium]